MFHTLTLEPKKFPTEYAIKTMSLATKKGKEWQKSLPQGVTPIKEKDYEIALGMRDSVYSHPQVKYLCQNHEAEKSVYWTREYGIECKCTPDIISDCKGLRFLTDDKST